MADDWDWFWAGETGRDRILRDEVEGLHASAARAHAQSSRLSSQLASLQGSLESRLTALSKAFDAYVELGDVREQLAAYPETNAVRRDVLSAMTDLSAARSAARVDPRDLDYWLPYAANAVIGLTVGKPDASAELRATELSRDAELFIVAAAGALGHGAQVAGRLPALLVNDGTLTPTQVRLWTAVCQGWYPGALPATAEAFRVPLARAEDREEWVTWVRAQSGGGTLEALRWMRRQIDTDLMSAAMPATVGGPGAASAADGRDGLRAVVVELVSAGMGEEVALLRRARELRAEIEHPGSTRPAEVDTAEPPAVAALAAVRQAWLQMAPGTPERRELLGWLAPGLTLAVEALDDSTRAVPASVMTASVRGRDVSVTVAGPDQAELARARSSLAAGHPDRRRAMFGLGVTTGVLAVAGIAVLVAGSLTALAVMALVVAGFTGYQWLRQARQSATDEEDVADSLAGLEERVLEVQAGVQGAERARLDTLAISVELSSAIRARLAEVPVGQPA